MVCLLIDYNELFNVVCGAVVQVSVTALGDWTGKSFILTHMSTSSFLQFLDFGVTSTENLSSRTYIMANVIKYVTVLRDSPGYPKPICSPKWAGSLYVMISFKQLSNASSIKLSFLWYLICAVGATNVQKGLFNMFVLLLGTGNNHTDMCWGLADFFCT